MQDTDAIEIWNKLLSTPMQLMTIVRTLAALRRRHDTCPADEPVENLSA